jgi:subtilisin family serine protease
MASPYVAGVAGLMLGVEPRLTAAQIMGIIRRTAVPLAGHDFDWRNDAGYGRIDAEACLEEAANAYLTTDRTP